MAYRHLSVRLGGVMGERRPEDHDKAIKYGFEGQALSDLLWWGSTANYRSH